MKFTPNDAEYMISYLFFVHYFVVSALEKQLVTKNTFFDRYRTLASLYSSNDFRTVTRNFVSGLLVLLRRKCICLLIKHLTIFRTYIIVHFFIHHNTLQQCIFSKMTGPSTLPFGEERIS